MFYPLFMQLWHYIWWTVIPASGFDFAKNFLVTNSYDARQQAFNAYGIIVSLWYFVKGSVTVALGDYDLGEVSISRSTTGVCLLNFGFDMFKTHRDVKYQMERFRAMQSAEDDLALFTDTEMYF